jgi:anti-sigma factor RsiW
VSGPSACAQIRPELGVYVLGAIAPADRARVGRHLASCPRCREEVAGLARLPGLLRTVPAAPVLHLSGECPDDPSGPPEPLDRLIGRVAAVRRRRRRALAAAAAVLAAAAATGWATQVLHPAAPPHPAAASWWAAAADGFNAATGARAAVRYTPQSWGTELEASVSGIPPGTRCQIWATTASGQHAAGGSWTVTRGAPHAWYPASVPFPAGSLADFDITTGGKVLVAIPLRPGTPPTRLLPRPLPSRNPAKARLVVIEQVRVT